ncbi:MAG: hypothetical protein CMP34_02795 [Rickettsiales bacterium]|nr:hypothetical protein [Rickettsiales bacterium]
MKFIMKNISFFLVIFFILFSSNLKAKSNKSRISVGVGYYNFLKNGYLEERYGVPGGVFQSANSRDSIAYNLEFFPKPKYKLFGLIQPQFGFIGTHQESFYSYFGLGMDIFVGKKKEFILHPSLAIGYLAGDQNDIQLGHPIEFKSGLDLMYRFRNGVRVGAGLYHVSNAALGGHPTHGTRNPGVEILMLKYQIPF